MLAHVAELPSLLTRAASPIDILNGAAELTLGTHPEDDPVPLEYLRDPQYGSYDINLEVDLITPEGAARTSLRVGYGWSLHHLRQQSIRNQAHAHVRDAVQQVGPCRPTLVLFRAKFGLKR